MNLLENQKYLDDMEFIYQGIKNEVNLKNKSFLIIGATGLLGSFLTDFFVYLNENKFPVEIYAVGRSISKAKKRFENAFDQSYFHFIEQNVELPFYLEEKIDYIIHAASNANPKLYATEPVETLTSNVIGMKNALELAKNNHTKRVIYISSGEMYGLAEEGMQSFTEDFIGKIDCGNPRSCYPEGKRAAEVLCQCYLEEYKIDTCIVRPCHVYGPTMSPMDNRAISSFIRDGVEGKNIVMKSKGEQIRSHCYVSDAIFAILIVLAKGIKGEAYNISADESIYSIKDMANFVCKSSGKKLVFDEASKIEKKGFSKIPLAVLDNTKVKRLGWVSAYSLQEGIDRTISILKEK